VLAETADRLTENRLMRSHDLTGAVFQRLIADRRFLAAYYTTPAAAALLAGLAITPAMLPAGLSWSDVADLGKLRIGDLACGTGTLVSTAYSRIGQLHELVGGDAVELHPVMMAGGLVGCDVLPAASHLTASMLAGAHPTRTYQRSTIYTVAYGKQPSGRIALGSIDMLDEQSEIECFAITSQAADPTGEDVNTRVRLPHRSFHLVIMNPPFTRPTSQEGERIGVPNPMFAAFGSSDEEQRLMGQAMRSRAKDSCYHGNAGEAAAFLALGNRKLKPDGVLALVMPLGSVAGESWEASRKEISNSFEDIVLVTIASPRDGTVAFSSDTRTADCLIVGRKTSGVAAKYPRRAVFVMLTCRPDYPLVGAEIARQIRRLIGDREICRLEDGPDGGTPVMFGDDTVGYAIDAPLPDSGSWKLSRITDLSLAQTAYQLAANGRLWLPGTDGSKPLFVPMSTVMGIGGILGPLDRDIEAAGGKTLRGVFVLSPVAHGMVPTYPILWSHLAERERTMVFDADREGHPIKGTGAQQKKFIAEKLASVCGTASHCHLNRDFRFNSQSTALQYTERPTIGGRAWPSIKLATPEQEKAFVAWGNTTLGLLMYWWHASKQQTGRGSIHKIARATMPVLDVTKLSPKALTNAVKLFDEMRDRRFLPVNEIADDENRHALDEGFARRVLGLDESLLTPHGPLSVLRAKLGCEPSISEGKQSRVGVIVGEDDEDDEN
jgi:hypothetical protein